MKYKKNLINLIIIFIMVLFCNCSSPQQTSQTQETQTESDSSQDGTFTENDYDDPETIQSSSSDGSGNSGTSTGAADVSGGSSSSGGSESSGSSGSGDVSSTPILSGLLTVTTPVDSSGFILSSPFGPRLKASDNYRYDFHRGIDIPGTLGDSIYSIADGTIFRAYREGSSAYPNGGNVIVIRYDLPTAVTFHNTSVNRIYAVYMHLNSFGSAAQAYLDSGETRSVLRGETIGTMGQTGDTDFTHLHFEIRMQTTCSLEYQLANPTASCASNGFDPHVNPVDLFSELVTGVYDLSLASSTDTSLVVAATADPTRLDIDGLLFEVFDPSDTETAIYSASFDFNDRTGFDASSTTTLDNSDIEGFVITPERFNSSSASYQMGFACDIPSSVWSGRSQISVRATLMNTAGVVVDTVSTSIAR